MAATSYSTLPTSTYVGLRTQDDPNRSTNYGTYETGIGSLTSHPYQYQTDTYETSYNENQEQPLYSNADYPTQQVSSDRYARQPTYDQHQPSNGYSNSQTSKANDRSVAMNNNENYATTNTIQPPHRKNMDNHHAESKTHQQTTHTGPSQHRPPVDNQHQQSQANLVRSERQIANYPPKQQQHKSQPPPQKKPTRSEHQVSKHRLSPPVLHPASSNDKKNHASEAAPKTFIPAPELKPTKLSIMRAAAIKKKEENLEQKRKDSYFPRSQNKPTPTKLKPPQHSPQTDVEQSDTEKVKRDKKKSHSLPKLRKGRQTDGEQSETEKPKRTKRPSQIQGNEGKIHRNGYHTEDDHSSGDDDDDDEKKHHRSKSQKRTTFSDSFIEKHAHLPPLRHGRMPPYYNPALNHPLPTGHPLRGRFPYHDDYPPYGPYPYSGQYDHRHLHEDAGDIPPYLAPYHDPYDPFFDYEKRKAKPKRRRDDNNPHTDHEDNGGVTGNETERDDGSKSQQSRKTKTKSVHNNTGGRKSRLDQEENLHPYWQRGYYPPHHYQNETDMLEIWRQQRNDYLKKAFKPTIHDVLYSQQWMKADGYLENQRRRTLRDTQGYYFPYKKYTLKDYKGLQKYNKPNPFAEDNETTIDRKERARKRQEYGYHIERQIADNPGVRHMPPREMVPRKPWHLSNGELNDLEKSSKRERALEYAKVQVKSRPIDSTKYPADRSDPTEQHVNDYYPHTNEDGDGSLHERTSKTNQSYDDYD